MHIVSRRLHGTGEMGDSIQCEPDSIGDDQNTAEQKLLVALLVARTRVRWALTDVAEADEPTPAAEAAAESVKPENESGTATLGLRGTVDGYSPQTLTAAPHLPSGPCSRQQPDSLGRGLSNVITTSEKQAVQKALIGIQAARTEVEVWKVARTLACALGTTRAETGTIKALHAVLLQMMQPGMSDVQAQTSTGATISSFKIWKRKVQPWS